MAKYNVSDGDFQTIASLKFEIERKLRAKHGSSLDPALVISAFEDILAGRFAVLKEEPQMLFLVSGGESLIVDACDGTEKLIDATDVFNFGISKLYNDLTYKGPDPATAATEAEVYELVRNANFKEIFETFGVPLESLCWTQAQIKSFCRQFPESLRKGSQANFFLMKNADEIFVSYPRIGSHGTALRIRNIKENNTIWDADDFGPYIVVPKLPGGFNFKKSA